MNKHREIGRMVAVGTDVGVRGLRRFPTFECLGVLAAHALAVTVNYLLPVYDADRYRDIPMPQDWKLHPATTI